MQTATPSRYVVKDSAIHNGEPIIDGTTTKVRSIVRLWKRGTPPEDIPKYLPQKVSLAQIFDALSYYADNRDEIDELLSRPRVAGSAIGKIEILSEDNHHLQDFAEYM